MIKKSLFSFGSMRGCRSSKRGFTLVEVCVSLLVMGVLAAATAAVFFYCLAGPLFICERAACANALSEAVESVVEGDAKAAGLRSCGSLLDLSEDSVTFNSYDGQQITLRLNPGDGRLYRSVDGQEEETLPYYAGEQGIKFSSVDGAVFRFYDEREKPASLPSKVARIEIALGGAGGLGAPGERIRTSITLK